MKFLITDKAHLGFCLRATLTLTLCYLISYFDTSPFSLWIIAGALFVTEVYFGASVAKAKERLLGLALGVILCFAVFPYLGEIKHSSLYWTLGLFFLAMYFRSLSYRLTMLFSTPIFLGCYLQLFPEGMTDYPWEKLVLLRFQSMVIGAAIALLLGALIYPRLSASPVERALGRFYLHTAELLELLHKRLSSQEKVRFFPVKIKMRKEEELIQQFVQQMAFEPTRFKKKFILFNKLLSEHQALIQNLVSLQLITATEDWQELPKLSKQEVLNLLDLLSAHYRKLSLFLTKREAKSCPLFEDERFSLEKQSMLFDKEFIQKLSFHEFIFLGTFLSSCHRTTQITKESSRLLSQLKTL